MLISIFSPKGGSGCSVVAALLALRTARAGSDVLLVDFADDLPAVLGCSVPDGPALADLTRLGSSVDPQAVDDVAVPISEHLSLVAAGAPPLGPAESALTLIGLRADIVVVDIGSVVGRARHPWSDAFVRAADRAILVVRPCYLALRHCGELPVDATEVIVVREPRRAFDTDTIAATVGAPVSHEVAYDPSIGRAVDAGLLGVLPHRGVRWIPAAS